MTDTFDYEAASRVWTDKEPQEARMPEEELRAEIYQFAAERKVCALACAGDGIVRNTPLEYLFFSDSFWIFTEGGLKFKALAANKDVCLTIFDSNPDFGKLKGLQVTGTAEVCEPFGPEYLKACEVRGIPAERMKSLPVPLHLLRIHPSRYDYLCSDLKSRGYSVRQHLVWEGSDPH